MTALGTARFHQVAFRQMKHRKPIDRDSMHRVLKRACIQAGAKAYEDDAQRMSGYLRDRAWLDAAMLLVEIEAPDWKLRRLELDGGEWHCTLSRRLEMPLWLDDAIDGRHAEIEGALLNACFAAAANALR